MKENLKTFPSGRSIWAYQRWKENFEKELREMKEKLEGKKQPIELLSAYVVIKEILGE